MNVGTQSEKDTAEKAWSPIHPRARVVMMRARFLTVTELEMKTDYERECHYLEGADCGKAGL